MLKDLKNSGRTVVCDNYFTSVPLADTLYDQKTYLIGTMRQKRVGVPREFVDEKLLVEQCAFLFSQHKTLGNYDDDILI